MKRVLLRFRVFKAPDHGRKEQHAGIYHLSLSIVTENCKKNLLHTTVYVMNCPRARSKLCTEMELRHRTSFTPIPILMLR